MDVTVAREEEPVLMPASSIAPVEHGGWNTT
jgi:hypothetical protein